MDVNGLEIESLLPVAIRPFVDVNRPFLHISLRGGSLVVHFSNGYEIMYRDRVIVTSVE